ncbi:MAG: CPBP family intramembrane metalloprotease [Anaerolineae bacterium]|nr:CPBP family intramembrane metalloprotease [Anaerolineae bacterium]
MYLLVPQRRSAIQDPTPSPRKLAARIFFSPDEPRLRAGWRILGHLALLFIFTIILSSILPILANLVTWLTFLKNAHLIALLAVTVSVHYARSYFDQRSFASLGLAWNWRAMNDLATGIAISAMMMGAIFVCEAAFGWVRIQALAWESQSALQILAGAAEWGLIFIAVGWYEELLIRGYFLQNLAAGLNMTAAIIISSAIFGLGHLGNPGASWASTLSILIAGLFFTYAYLRTQQLWLPIGLHIGWNFFQGPIFGFPVSGLETSRLVIHTTQGPEWLTGGVFGPEAGAILLPALAIGAFLVQRYSHGRTNTIQNHNKD